MDKFIAGGIVVTMDKERRILEDGAVAIQGDRILDLGDTQSLKNQYRPQPSQILNGRGKVIFPGFINLHTHAGLSILRGVGDETVTFPSYTRSIPQGVMLSPEDMYVFSMLGGLEALKFGTTTIVDNYIYSLQNVRAFNDLGMRAVVSERIHDADLFKIPSGVYQFSQEIGEKRLEENLKLIEEWHTKGDGRVCCRLGPHAPDTCSETYLRKVRDVANRLKVGMVTHVAQGLYEGDVIRKRTGGLSPVRFLNEMGLLGKDLIAAHCIFVDDDDIEILANTGTHVTHQPEGNAKYGLMAPASKMKKAGINVGIGTDNMAADMIEAMRFAVCIGRVKEQSAGAIRAMDALEMATINGARALGMEHEIGSIEVGKKADLVLIDYRKPHLIPLVDPVANLIHTGLGSDVDTVIVNGQTLVEQGRVMVVNESEIIRQAQHLAVLRWKEIAGKEIRFDLFAS
jgi:5-methylthioadenosine/S-adenosylhomocysteine deaminase